MKRAVLIAITVILIAAGIYCGRRYYEEAYLPKKQLAEADSAQRELFAEIRPDLTELTNISNNSTTKRDAAEGFGKDGADGGVSEAEDDPLAGLKSVNPDAVGWITIDGTGIDYPIVQSTDNTYYLKRGFDRQFNDGLGCPFLDCRCKEGLGGFNSIVYAHHINGMDMMFADIVKYKDKSFMQKCPTGTLLTENGLYNVRFFAYMTLPSDSPAYTAEFASKRERDEYIDFLFDNAKYTMNYTSDELKERGDTRLLLLSTCTYEYREARGVLAGVAE